MKIALTMAAFLLAGSFWLLTAEDASNELFEGCAMPLESNHTFLTLCELHTCSLLRGKVDLKWAGHSVKVRGVLHKPTSTQPRTIEVQETVQVGKSCNASCRPPVSGRGLGSKDHPDGEGATPGVAPKSTNPPGQP